MSNYQTHIETLQQRFATALNNNNYSGVLIYAGQQSYAFRDDNAYAFKTNPYFKYWLPLTKQQHSFIYIAPGKKPHLYLFQQQDYWHAQPQIPDGEWQELFDLTVIDDVVKALAPFANNSNLAVIADNHNSNGLFSQWSAQHINPEGLMNELDFNRAYKTAYEVDCMRTANALAAKAHLAAKDAFFNGRTEFEVHQAYLSSLQVRETALPYNNIVAFNQNASVLHYDDYSTTIPERRLSFLIDAGADYNGYCADISRTYVNTDANGADEFSACYQAYQHAYYQLLDEISLGKSFLSLHDSAHQKIANLLAQFKIVNCSAEAAYEKGYTQLFFPCGTGHYIGAQVHDVGGYLANEQGQMLAKDARCPFLRLLRPIEENIVFTVEPGIYFIDQLLAQVSGNSDFNWQQISQFKQFGGFRMEDCLSITKNGIENLSQNGFDLIK